GYRWRLLGSTCALRLFAAGRCHNRQPAPHTTCPFLNKRTTSTATGVGNQRHQLTRSSPSSTGVLLCRSLRFVLLLVFDYFNYLWLTKRIPVPGVHIRQTEDSPGLEPFSAGGQYQLSAYNFDLVAAQE